VDRILLTKLESFKKEKDLDEEGAFCESLAQRIRHFSSRQKAIAYIEINKLLLNIEFPGDPYHSESHL